MENNTQKRCVFPREKYGNWEITETYSVTFRNFPISAFLQREKCRKTSEKYSHSDHFSLAASFLCWKISLFAGCIEAFLYSSYYSAITHSSTNVEQLRCIFATLLNFFYIVTAPLCLTRENARQSTAGRGF
jgi:hypothetical protein